MNYCKVDILLVIICIVLLSACRTNGYGTMVCGDVYISDGTQMTIVNNDRLKLPKRSGNLVIVRNAYNKDNKKEKLHYDNIDSIRVWHPASPNDVWTMLKIPTYGWCIRYVDAPHIQVLTHSTKGYGVFASGRFVNFYTRRIFSKSKVHFLIVKQGMPANDIGGTTGYGSKRWCERICKFVADDPELCKLIMQSRRRKSETLRLLSQYKYNQ